MTRSGRTAVAAVALLAGLQTGCETMSNTTKGAGIGTAIGAGVGTAIGAATGNPKTGAVVGGLIGGGVGAGVGSDIDRDEKEKADIRHTEATIAQAQAQAAAGKLGMTDVIQLVQQGQSEAVIVNQIRATGSTFQLSTQDLAYLKSCNVPDGVVMAMQNARPQPVVVQPRQPRTVYVEQPTVIYRDPFWGPPPPPAFGVTYIRRGW